MAKSFALEDYKAIMPEGLYNSCILGFDHRACLFAYDLDKLKKLSREIPHMVESFPDFITEKVEQGYLIVERLTPLELASLQNRKGLAWLKAQDKPFRQNSCIIGVSVGSENVPERLVYDYNELFDAAFKTEENNSADGFSLDDMNDWLSRFDDNSCYAVDLNKAHKRFYSLNSYLNKLLS